MSYAASEFGIGDDTLGLHQATWCLVSVWMIPSGRLRTDKGSYGEMDPGILVNIYTLEIFANSANAQTMNSSSMT